MAFRINNILITGKPGSGKTTLFKRLVKALRHLEPVGFYTQEIREGGVHRHIHALAIELQLPDRLRSNIARLLKISAI